MDEAQLNYDRYIVFDVETPNRYNSRISAIGISIVENGCITDSYFSYVNPEQSFDWFNTQLTGIDEHTVADAPTFSELWETIEPVFSSGILVAHNAVFDMGVLKKCLRDYAISWKRDVPYCCTVQMGRRLLPDIKHSLDQMCVYYGISLDHHKADSDARAAAQILLRYMNAGARIKPFVKTYRLSEESESQVLTCPRCGKALVLRTAGKGFHAGRQFYGCAGYPKCRYVQNL